MNLIFCFWTASNRADPLFAKSAFPHAWLQFAAINILHHEYRAKWPKKTPTHVTVIYGKSFSVSDPQWGSLRCLWAERPQVLQLRLYVPSPSFSVVSWTSVVFVGRISAFLAAPGGLGWKEGGCIQDLLLLVVVSSIHRARCHLPVQGRTRSWCFQLWRQDTH